MTINSAYQHYIVALNMPTGIKVSLVASSMLEEMLASKTPTFIQEGKRVAIRVAGSDLVQITNHAGYNDCTVTLQVLKVTASNTAASADDRLLLAFDTRLAITNTIAAWRIDRLGTIRRTSEEAVQAAYTLFGNSTHWMAGIRFWVSPTGMLMSTGGPSREVECYYEVVERHNYELFSKRPEEVNI